MGILLVLLLKFDYVLKIIFYLFPEIGSWNGNKLLLKLWLILLLKISLDDLLLKVLEGEELFLPVGKLSYLWLL